MVRKRATRDLQRAQARLHLVQGFLLAMGDLDKVRPRFQLRTQHARTPARVRTDSLLRSHHASGPECDAMP